MLLLSMLFVVACSSDSDIKQIKDKTAGKLQVVNLTTGESVICSGALTINVGDAESGERLTVHNGDKLRMEYVPDEKYSEYSYVATYVFEDATNYITSDKTTQYEFTIMGQSVGLHKIQWSASYSQENIEIGGSGYFYVEVEE